MKAVGDIKGSRAVREIADKFQDWQRENKDKVKLPD
jgi:predicted Zn-dependent peptidase